MRQHNGMRPQDIVVLVKIVLWENRSWQFQELARALYISPAEVSESVNRSSFAGLINHERKKVHRLSFFEFLQFGMPYVFPQSPGSLTKGMATGHCHRYFSHGIISNDVYVWPELNGSDYGQAIQPFYHNQVKAAKKDELLYEALAVLDVIRTGKSREKKMAIEYLHQFFKHGSPDQYYQNAVGS
jgi:hypothetical protein